MKALLSRVFLVVIFPFINLNMPNHFLLPCRVSPEESADNLTGILFYVICCFSLVAFNIFFLSFIFLNLVNMCLGTFLLVFLLYMTLCFLNLGDFSIIGKFSDIISSKYFVKPFLYIFFSGPL